MSTTFLPDVLSNATLSVGAEAGIVDVMPENARTLMRWNTYMVMVISSILNSMLITVLLTERNAILRAYTNVLIVNCICDLVYTVIMFITDFQCELNDDVFVFVVGGIYTDKPITYIHIGMFFYVFALYTSIMVIPIVFYFRYQLVVKNRQMTRHEIVRLSMYSVGAALFPASSLTAAYVFDKRRLSCEELLTAPMWKHGGNIDKCLTAQTDNPMLRLYLLLLSTVNFTTYGLMIYFTFAIFRAIKRNKTTVNAKTARLQRQMNILLVVQLVLPILCACIPLTLVIIVSMNRLRFRGLGVLVILGIEWIPLANPLITILLVTNYRRRTARILLSPLVWCCNWVLSRDSRAVANSGVMTTDDSHDGGVTHDYVMA